MTKLEQGYAYHVDLDGENWTGQFTSKLTKIVEHPRVGRPEDPLYILTFENGVVMSQDPSCDFTRVIS